MLAAIVMRWGVDAVVAEAAGCELSWQRPGVVIEFGIDERDGADGPDPCFGPWVTLLGISHRCVAGAWCKSAARATANQ